MPRPFWSGTLSFGLVAVPVDLYPAHRRSRRALRLLSPEGHPVSRRYVCPREGNPVPPEEIVRGYEVEKGRHVVVEDEELEALQPEKSRDIDLRSFVDRDAIDPFYFDRAYFLTPGGDSTKAYRLLAAVMEETGRAGVATFVMRGKEYLVAILADDGILRAETLRFADEVRSLDDVGLGDLPAPPKAAVAAARKAVRALAADEVDRDELHDGEAEALEALARRKRRRGEGVVEVAEAEDDAADDEEAPADLMNVLKWSLRRAKGDGASEETKRGAAPDDLAGRSKAELYELARSRDLPGRSGMTKDELARALRRSA